MKIAKITKEDKLIAIRLFNNGVYEATDYCRNKRDIKPHLKIIGYKVD